MVLSKYDADDDEEVFLADQEVDIGYLKTQKVMAFAEPEMQIKRCILKQVMEEDNEATAIFHGRGRGREGCWRTR